MSRLIRSAGAVLIFWAFAAPAAAQEFGIKAGASVNPDQFYFGAHVQTAPLADEWRFRPNVEIGLGNDVTVVALNLEFIYKFPSSREWSLYAGGGPALNIIDTEQITNSEEGLSFLAGLVHTRGLFGEVKFGVLEYSDFKIAVGYSFEW